jgi:hypothetical protein
MLGRGIRRRKDRDKVPTDPKEALKHVKHSPPSIGSLEHPTPSLIIQNSIALSIQQPAILIVIKARDISREEERGIKLAHKGKQVLEETESRRGAGHLPELEVGQEVELRW